MPSLASIPRVTRHRLALAAMLALTLPASAAASATGTVTVDGTTWQVADAVAMSNDGDVELWFTQLEFDRVAWAEDGEFDSFDIHEFKDDGNGPAFSVDVDEDTGKYGGHTLRFSSSGSSSSYSSDLVDSLTLTHRDDKRIAGTVKLDDGSGLVADIRFDLPITRTGPMARPGTALPADGGEPGKALKAMIEATHAGNLDRMTELSHPERRAGIEQARAAGESDQMLRMAQAFTPTLRRIVGGTTEGDRAWVDFEGDADGNALKGTAELTRHEGRWYLDGIKTRN